MKKILIAAVSVMAASPSFAGVAFTKSSMEFDYERRFEYGYTNINPSDILQPALLGTEGSILSTCVESCRGTDSRYDESCIVYYNYSTVRFDSFDGYYYKLPTNSACSFNNKLATITYSGPLGSDSISFKWIYPKGMKGNGFGGVEPVETDGGTGGAKNNPVETDNGTGGAKNNPVDNNPAVAVARQACDEIPVGELNNIRGVMTGAAVVSGIGAAGNIAASAGNVYGAIKDGQAKKAADAAAAGESGDEAAAPAEAVPVETAAVANNSGLKPGEAFKGQQMMNTITAGVGAAAGTTSTIINAASAGKLGKIIDQIEGCKSALGKITAGASDSASLEEQMSASNSRSDAKSACNKISVSDIKGLKGAMIAAAVISGIGAAGNIASAAGHVVGAVKNAQEKKANEAAASSESPEDESVPAGTAVVANGGGLKPGESFQGQNIVNVASSGVGAATGVASTAMSAAAAGKLDNIIASVEKCRDAASRL